MKRKLLKRAAVTAIGCTFLVTMVGCSCSGSSSSSSSSSESTVTPTDEMTESTTGTETQYENLQLGMGIVLSHDADSPVEGSTMSTSGTVSHTAITLLLEDGVICGSMLDEHESAVSSLDGGLALPAEVQSKREQGDAYGMRSYSGIGKEWYEQADAFCTYIQGMTCEEVMAISVDEYGKATDAELMAGCTISISEFQQAVEKACDNAKNVTDMDMEDYTNYKNSTASFWDDLVDGTEDVLDGVEDGVSDVVDGVGDVATDVTDGMTDGTNDTKTDGTQNTTY